MSQTRLGDDLGLVAQAPALKLTSWAGLLDLQELDFEDERRVGRNHTRVTLGTVGEFRRDSELALPAHAHRSHTFVPTFNHLAAPQHETKRLIAID